jgi:hypothetical protein
MPEMGRTNRWVCLAIDCPDASPVARFYERLLGARGRDGHGEFNTG